MVLGANDGLISTASLMIGVAAANSERSPALVAGFAGLAAGALSMAAGEYVSVASQRDTEMADLARERREVVANPSGELDELREIYEKRGLSSDLAYQVAVELSRGDVLAAHARDELGLDPEALADPVQAAAASAGSFAAGACFPIVLMLLASQSVRIPLVVVCTLVMLGALGAVGAGLGGAPKRRAAVRVLIGGALALGISALVGRAVKGVG